MQESAGENYDVSARDNNRINPPQNFEGGDFKPAQEEKSIEAGDNFQLLTPQQQEDAIVSHYGAVKSFILSRLYAGDGSYAEDLTQDTILQGLHSRGQIARIGTLKTWLCRIALNKVYDRHRKETGGGKRRYVSLDSSGIGSTDDKPLPMDISVGGENEQIKAIDIALLKKYVERLPPAHREPLLLYYFEGLSTLEIARRLHMNVNALKVQLFRGRNGLRDEMKKHQTRGKFANTNDKNA